MNALRFLAMFAISLTLAFASFGIAAAQDLNIDLVSAPPNVSHSAGSFNVVFNVSYIGDSRDNVPVTFAPTITQGSATTTFSPTTIVLGNLSSTNPQSMLVTLTVTFPQLQSGSIGGNVQVSTAGLASDSANFNVPITSQSALSATKAQEIGKTVNGTFTLKNIGNQLLSNILLSVSGDFGASLSTSSLTLAPGITSSLIQVIPNIISDLKFGSNTVTVVATDQGTGATTSVPFTIQGSFCKSGQAGANLSIASVTVRNTGDEDETWNPLDQITVKVDVDNNGLADMKEVYVKIGLFDSAGSNKINNVDFTSTDEEEISVGTVNDGGTEKVTFEFTVPADMKDGSYKLAVKAYSKKTGEAVDCADRSSDMDQNTYQTIDVEKRSKQGELIAITNFQVPDQNICGTTLAGSFDVANVGDTDQDQVLIRMRSPDLGIEQEFEIKENFDVGDISTLNFNVELPTNIKDGSYRVFFRTTYDYRNGAYHESSKDETEEVVKVIGCSGTGSTGGTGTAGNAAITATLGSDAKAGENLVVNAVIRNLANSQQTFVIDAKGYQSWAALDSISDRIITLNAGESKSISIILNVDASATSPQEFTIETLAEGKTTSQIVDIRLAESTSSGFSFAGNGLIWVIGAINLVLIILIIVVAVRVSRR